MLQNLFGLFVNSISEDGEITYNLTMLGYIGIIILVLLLLVIISASSNSSKSLNIKQVTFSSIAIALAVVTSFIKPFSLPFGGSITFFSMFFICYVSYLYGAKTGLITGVAYGLLQFVVGPYLYHPVQVLLDYPVAFGCLGLAGLFHGSKYGLLKGYLVGAFGRFLCHSISGYIFFASYAPEGMNPIWYTITYNASYILPEAIATVILLTLPPVRSALKHVSKLATSEV